MTVALRYPLSAIVGQDDLVTALLVCAVNPAVGGVLVRGERGTAKSTAARALAPMLAAGEGSTAALVEVPLGATLDRLVGSLDVRAALDGEHRAEAGLLAKAHGGVLYVDEVNLLGDHLVDALLDAAAAGRVVVERDGISVESPARFLLVGTMNPEEGELRPQLLDRFGLGVQVAGPRDPKVRAEIVRRRMAFDADPAAFVAQWADEETAIAGRLSAARDLLGGVVLSDRMLERITSVCANLDLDGVRGDLVCAQTARGLAALAGATEVQDEHVAQAAHLALRHRLRRDPLAPPPTGGGEPAIDAALDASDASPEPGNSLNARSQDEAYDAAHPDHIAEAGGESGHRGGGSAVSAGTKDGVGRRGGSARADGDAGADPSGGRYAPDAGPGWQPSPDLAPPPSRPQTGTASEQPGDGPAPRAVRPTAIPSRIPSDALSLTRRTPAAARPADGFVPAGRARGGNLAVVDARPASGDEPIAALPTLLAALRGERVPMTPIRGGGRSALVVLIVDASGSMAARRRLARVKGAVEAALRVAYARRDRVAVVAFSGDGAETIVAPGTPLEQAAAAIAELPAGGRTPLAEGLEHAAALLTGRPSQRPSGAERESHVTRLAADSRSIVDDGRARLVVLMTDGRAADPEGRAARALAAINEAADRTVVVDLEDGRARLGMAGELAARAGADLTRLVTPDQPAGMSPQRSSLRPSGDIHGSGRAA